MELTKLTRDGTDYTLNGGAPDGIVVIYEVAGQSSGVQSSLVTRQRSHFTPAIDDVSLNAKAQPFTILYRPDRYTSATGTIRDYHELVSGIFRNSSGPVTLTGTWNGVTYTAEAWITNARPGDAAIWEGTFVFADPYWQSATSETVTSSPITVGGNAETRPTITISEGEACTHYRAALLDNTGHGFAGWPVGITVGAGAASTCRAFFDGHEVPFSKDGTTLWVFGAAKVGQTSYVDVYQGAGISNTTHADMLDTGGVDLSTWSSNTVESDPSGARTQPPNVALAWRPGITFKSSDSRNYTFGLDGDDLTMIDREATGVRYNLNDDADALVAISPVPITKISGLGLSVFSGYKPSIRDSQSEDGERVLRVVISDIDGGFETGPASSSTLLSEPGGDGPRHPNTPYYATWTFGQITFPGTFSENKVYNASEYGLGAGTYGGDIWYEDYLPSEFQSVVEKYLGVTVTTGETGEWFLHFPAGAFLGADLPDLSMSLNPKGGSTVRVTGAGDTETVEIAGRTDLDNVILFDTEWVDPDTMEPFDPDDAPGEEALRGQIKAVVKYALRDSEGDWITAWSQVVSGSAPDGTTEAISVPEQTFPADTVGIAIGLEPASTSPGSIDWGTLEVTAAPTITVSSAQSPTVTLSSEDGQHLDGQIKNDDTGVAIVLRGVLSPATGVEIDTDGLTIEPVAGGMVYGEPLPSGGVRMFDLHPGEVAWSTTGNLSSATVEFDVRDRLAI